MAYNKGAERIRQRETVVRNQLTNKNRGEDKWEFRDGREGHGRCGWAHLERDMPTATGET